MAPADRGHLKTWRNLSKYYSVRIFVAEMVGTALLVFLSNSCLAQVLIGNRMHIETLQNATHQPGKTAIPLNYGQWLSYAVGNGLGYSVTLGTITGTREPHLNPAITVAAALSEMRLVVDWPHVPVILSAQLIGGFLGACLLVSVHSHGLRLSNPKDKYSEAMMRALGAYPMPTYKNQSMLSMFWDHTFASTLLVVVYLISHDPDPEGMMASSRMSISFGPILTGMGPMLNALTNGVISAQFSNPARDLPPRVLASVFFGKVVWERPTFEENGISKPHYFFWIPIVSPFAGALLGTFIYATGVAFHRSPIRERRPAKFSQQVKDAQEKIKLLTKMVNKLQEDVTTWPTSTQNEYTM